MSEEKKGILKRILRPRYYVPLAVILLILAIVFSKRGGAPVYKTVTLARANIVQEVSVTGETKPLKSVDLSFERSGRIVSAPVKIGDHVSVGQQLAAIDATSDSLSLKQAQANLAAEQANLADLLSGARPEDVDVLRSQLASAEISVTNAKADLFQKIKDAYTRADDAVHNGADQFFDNGSSAAPSVNITVSDAQLKNNLNQSRADIEQRLDSWQTDLSGLSLSADMPLAGESAKANLGAVADFLNKLSLAVNALTPTQSLSLTTITSYKTTVSTARTSINTALSNVTTGEEGLNTALSAGDVANKNLLASLAAADPEKVQAEQAKIEALKAQIDSINHSIAVSVLRSPITGTVTKQDAKIGQMAVSGSPLISVISDGGLEIEAYVPEVDIGKIKVGNAVNFTLDAFQGEDFSSQVTYIDPAETVIDGVPTYRVTFSLEQGERIRPGMTANLVIKTAEKDQALVLPQRAVIGTASGKYVNVMNADKTISEIPVETGLRGADGNIEIVSGLSEGANVVVEKK